jgi:16S rRNA processing protein RimM
LTEKRVLLGVIARAHGVKGEVRVKCFTEEPQSVGAYGALTTEDGRRLEIAELRVIKGGEVILRFACVSDRSTAESLKGRGIYVYRSALPTPASGEFYHADLAGLRAEDAAGALIGTIRAVHNFGAGDVIEVEFSDGGTEFVAFTDANVPVIDVAGGRLVIVPPRDDDEE